MNCRNCKADCAEKGTDHEKKSCLGYVPMTNADRIRSMTGEELAEFLAVKTDCVNCPCRDGYDECDTADGTCQKQWLDWLKEEVEDG